jgi:type IV pilus assembly protein PilF
MAMPRSFALACLPLLALALAGCQSAGSRAAGADGSIPGARAASPSDVYVELAAAYLQDGQVAVALAKAQTAVEKDSRNPQAHMVLGMVHQRMGDDAKAESEFLEALRGAPGDFYVQNAYGVFLCKQRRYADADAQFDAAMRSPLNESPWVALTNSAMCAQEQGERTRAEGQLREALQRNPTFAPALLRMARLSLEAGDPAAARGYLQRYQAVGQHNAESLGIAAEAERRAGDRNKAAAYERLLRERYPDAPDAARARGR